MTRRICTLTVALEEDTRIDDIQPLIDAIKHLRGVLDVEAVDSSPDIWTAHMRAKHELGQKIWEVLYPK